jgi:hypothetical protein
MPPFDVEGRLQGGRGRRLVVLADGGPPYDAHRLLKSPHDFFVTSSLQVGAVPPAAKGGDERARFVRALLASGEYRVRRFSIAPPLWGDPTGALPEDMQYVNPEIYVLERRGGEAVAATGRRFHRDERPLRLRSSSSSSIVLVLDPSPREPGESRTRDEDEGRGRLGTPEPEGRAAQVQGVDP